MQINRKWAMPSSDTFDVPPIGEFVKSYLRQSIVSVDPFARNKRWATYTNDLNPDTAAEHHLDALEFLEILRDTGTIADLVIFDPPYSPRQLAECYQQVGKVATSQDMQSKSWSDWKNAVAEIVPVGGVVLSFGWNTVGMGRKHNFEIVEILMVCHGGVHNDTICMAERKTALQGDMFNETHLTPREPDKGDSSPLAALSNPEAFTAFGVSS